MVTFFQKILVSFSNIILSLPFTILGLARFENDEIKADWQPPGYVFGIVWPILYLLFAFINLRIYDLKSLTQSKRNILINQALTESLVQTLWLLVSANYGGGRNLIQNFIGLLVMVSLVLYCYLVRIPSLKENDFTSFILYLPYSAWISFAFILNLQIVINYIK